MKLLRFNEGYTYKNTTFRRDKDTYNLLNDKDLVSKLGSNLISLTKYAANNIKNWHISNICTMLNNYLPPDKIINDFIHSDIFIRYINRLPNHNIEFIKNWNNFYSCLDTLKTKLSELHDIEIELVWNYELEVNLIMPKNNEDGSYINASTLFNISSELKDFESDLGYEINIDFFSGKISIQL